MNERVKEEKTMTQDENKKHTPGRKFDQPASGSNSAASMGSAGTGDAGSTQTATGGAQQSAGRTDDLLSGGQDADAEGKGFAGGPGAKRPPEK
ncbi:MAG TPA: hypothetical protein VF861_11155 [Telluria sp.]